MDARKGKDKLELIKKDGWVREEHVLSAGINQEWCWCFTDTPVKLGFTDQSETPIIEWTTPEPAEKHQTASN